MNVEFKQCIVFGEFYISVLCVIPNMSVLMLVSFFICVKLM